MSRWFDSFLALGLVLGIPVFLVLSNVFLIMTPEWLAFQYNQPGFPKSERFSDADRYYFASESIEFVRSQRSLAQFRALGVYEEREIKHMVDVRNLVEQASYAHFIAGVWIALTLVSLGYRRATHRLAAQSLLSGAILTLGFFAVLGLFAAIGFQTFFTLFHKIFFEGDTWLFNYTDSLIQFYPLPFWFATSIALVTLTIGEALIVGGLGWGWRKKS